MNPEHTKPINRQASTLFTRKRHTETVQQAIDAAAEKLLNGSLNKYLAEVFSTDQFGPEPTVEYTIKIRRDPASPGKFSYQAKVKVAHQLGNDFRLHGLSAQS